MQRLHRLQVSGQGCAQIRGQQGSAIFSPFALANYYLCGGKVDVFDAQARALEESETRAVEEARHELRCAVHSFEDCAHLLFREHYGQRAMLARSNEVVDPGRGFVEHALVQEAERTSCLKLSGRTSAPDQQLVEELFDSSAPSSRGWRL